MHRVLLRFPVLQAVYASVMVGLLFAGAVRCGAQTDGPEYELVASVADQRMALLCDGGLVTKFPISTSKFGIGDAYGSYKTPLGRLKICEKIGSGFVAGAVIKHRSATGEVLPVNAPGRDPIVTRILWLDGQEEQNRNAKERGIYIHGTPEERTLGLPVSWGCIRMRSVDIIQLFELVEQGTPVTIMSERLPRYPKYDPRAPKTHSETLLVAASSQLSSPSPKAPLLGDRLPSFGSSAFSGAAMGSPGKGGRMGMGGSILFAGLSAETRTDAKTAENPKSPERSARKTAPETLPPDAWPVLRFQLTLAEEEIGSREGDALTIDGSLSTVGGPDEAARTDIFPLAADHLPLIPTVH